MEQILRYILEEFEETKGVILIEEVQKEKQKYKQRSTKHTPKIE